MIKIAATILAILAAPIAGAALLLLSLPITYECRLIRDKAKASMTRYKKTKNKDK